MTAVYLLRGADGKAEASGLLALALREFFGVKELPVQARLPGGKPWFPARPELHFNLSHSGPLALCGVGNDPLGVDVELLRPRQAGLPRYALSEAEFSWYRDRGGRWEDFYTLWTLKEARVKWEGGGLRRAPRTVAVPLIDTGETEVRDGLTFRAWGGPDWRGAACVRGQAPPAQVLLAAGTPPSRLASACREPPP